MPWNTFAQSAEIEPESQDVVFSSLTLDRVANTGQLIANMVRALRKGGCFAFFNLFPISFKDDEPVEHPITYTPPEGRIIPETGSLQQDVCALRDYIFSQYAIPVEPVAVPYRVRTATGEQNYTGQYIGLVGKNEND